MIEGQIIGIRGTKGSFLRLQILSNVVVYSIGICYNLSILFK